MKHQPRGISRGQEHYLRANATEAERRLWFGLREQRTFKWRRQHRIENYIVDFYCVEVKVAVEVDGSVHSREDVRLRDEERDAELRKLGIQVLRFSDGQVLCELGNTVRQIEDICLGQLPRERRREIVERSPSAPHPNPSPRR